MNGEMKTVIDNSNDVSYDLFVTECPFSCRLWISMSATTFIFRQLGIGVQRKSDMDSTEHHPGAILSQTSHHELQTCKDLLTDKASDRYLK